MFNGVQIDLTYEECGSVEEAQEIGKKNPALDYHILVKNLKIVCVMHPIWQECLFCDMEIEEDAPIIIGHNEFI